MNESLFIFLLLAGARSIRLAATPINTEHECRSDCSVIIDSNLNPPMESFSSRRASPCQLEASFMVARNNQPQPKTQVFAACCAFPSLLSRSGTVTAAAAAPAAALLHCISAMLTPDRPSLAKERDEGRMRGKTTSDIMIHNHLIQFNSGVPRHRKSGTHGRWL